jgi:hypothetical protein
MRRTTERARGDLPAGGPHVASTPFALGLRLHATNDFGQVRWTLPFAGLPLVARRRRGVPLTRGNAGLFRSRHPTPGTRIGANTAIFDPPHHERADDRRTGGRGDTGEGRKRDTGEGEKKENLFFWNTKNKNSPFSPSPVSPFLPFSCRRGSRSILQQRRSRRCGSEPDVCGRSRTPQFLLVVCWRCATRSREPRHRLPPPRELPRANPTPSASPTLGLVEASHFLAKSGGRGVLKAVFELSLEVGFQAHEHSGSDWPIPASQTSGRRRRQAFGSARLSP